jgi:hypothetical protein
VAHPDAIANLREAAAEDGSVAAIVGWPARRRRVDYRMDTPSARAFLAQYVTLP